MRPGEKLHEEMISSDDSRRTVIMNDRFVVTPIVSDWGFKIPKGIQMEEGVAYRSDTNDLWLAANEIEAILRKLGLHDQLR
jgi:UDP-N-acetylglucosamine 4,6-dehydratase